MKYYHLLSDDKTVKEITWDQYRELCQRKGHKVVALAPQWINIRKGENFIYVNLRQLNQVFDIGG